jgi:hypothetical protein
VEFNRVMGLRRSNVGRVYLDTGGFKSGIDITAFAPGLRLFQAMSDASRHPAFRPSK